MRIDVHAHVVPDAYLALVRQGAVPDVRLVRDGAREVLEVHGGGASGPVVQRLPLDASWHDPAARLAAMDAAGVDVHVLSPVQFMYHYWLDGSCAAALARTVNDGIAAMTRHAPRRLVGMATLPLQDPAASVAELDRVHALGFRAVEIGTHVAGTPLDAPGLTQVYDGPDARIYELSGALPRVWVVGEQRVVDGEDAALAAITDPGFDARAVAVTEDPIEGLDGGGGTAEANAAARDGNFRPVKLPLQVHA